MTATSRTTFQEAVFTPDGARPTERVYNLSRQVLEFRRAIVPLAELLDRRPRAPLGAPRPGQDRRHPRP